MSAPLAIERAGGVVRLALDRPTHNVLDRALNRALAEAVRMHAADPSVAVLVLTGGKARGFSAGVEVADHTPERIGDMLADFHGAIRALWDAECVTVAAVHGFALGGGFELALACDLVVAASDTRLGFPEIRLGCYPPVAAALLPVRIGWSAACELVMVGEEIDAPRARALGLVNRVAEPGALDAEVAALVASLHARSPAVLREAKRALREGARAAPAEALRAIEVRYLESLMRLDDATEGIQAFLEKRSPRFTNR